MALPVSDRIYFKFQLQGLELTLDIGWELVKGRGVLAVAYSSEQHVPAASSLAWVAPSDAVNCVTQARGDRPGHSALSHTGHSGDRLRPLQPPAHDSLCHLPSKIFLSSQTLVLSRVYSFFVPILSSLLFPKMSTQAFSWPGQIRQHQENAWLGTRLNFRGKA